MNHQITIYSLIVYSAVCIFMNSFQPDQFDVTVQYSQRFVAFFLRIVIFFKLLNNTQSSDYLFKSHNDQGFLNEIKSLRNTSSKLLCESFYQSLHHLNEKKMKIKIPSRSFKK